MNTSECSLLELKCQDRHTVQPKDYLQKVFIANEYFWLYINKLLYVSNIDKT